MITLDLKKDLKAFYQPPVRKVEVVEVPRFNFLVIDGAIEPGMAPDSSPMFEENMAALYGAAYTLKFTLKKRAVDPVDYPVMALEGLWDVRDGNFDFAIKDNWVYTLMILVPDLITQDIFEQALAQLREKKGDQPGLARLRLDSFAEGLCVQTMHIGPYANEPETLERMQAFMQTNGYRDLVGAGGKHHEIYLGDPRRAAPDKLKTVLRHPVAK
ncbi:MAG: GyrI-like domain-containing protein [Anaerolineales bacterium]|nr:GyrI-like domain-containing protein [Anaerolineales bacterium]